uniref:Uncharacterized protein n=1 Tax=Picea sitchensis TaxID=3332 RepID=D5AD56_PICSI|nr:unknown [Picea sitchensis]
MLNVNRCSQVAFPGETIMQEAKLCTERYLRNALEDVVLYNTVNEIAEEESFSNANNIVAQVVITS